MELRRFSLQRYKGYAGVVDVDLAPLTLLVGPNNSGKTALAQAIPLLAGGLDPPTSDAREPLPLQSCGIRHGEAFEDLVTGRAAHGRLELSITVADTAGELSLSATVVDVKALDRPPERQILEWRLQSRDGTLEAERQGFSETGPYRISGSGASPGRRPIVWRGLLPGQPRELAEWMGPRVDALKTWAAGVRHLRCPRRLAPSPFLAAERAHAPADIRSDGHDAPLALAADSALRKQVRRWYRDTFGASIDVVAQGRYQDLVTETPVRDNGAVRIEQAGRGLSHVLPVAVTALSARAAGPGVDIIEHPEAELHPAAHADIAELLLDNLVGSARPLVVETHSEMILLRARRWVAEGRLPPEDVLVYWVHAEPQRGSVLEKIRVQRNGEMETWPEGVFIEDYEEILAIRRARRDKVEA